MNTLSSNVSVYRQLLTDVLISHVHLEGSTHILVLLKEKVHGPNSLSRRYPRPFEKPKSSATVQDTFAIFNTCLHVKLPTGHQMCQEL